MKVYAKKYSKVNTLRDC